MLEEIDPILPSQYEFLKDDNEKNDNLKKEDILNMNFTIPNEPFKSLEKKNNPNIYLTTFNEPKILSQTYNSNNFKI